MEVRYFPVMFVAVVVISATLSRGWASESNIQDASNTQQGESLAAGGADLRDLLKSSLGSDPESNESGQAKPEKAGSKSTDVNRKPGFSAITYAPEPMGGASQAIAAQLPHSLQSDTIPSQPTEAGSGE